MTMFYIHDGRRWLRGDQILVLEDVPAPSPSQPARRRVLLKSSPTWWESVGTAGDLLKDVVAAAAQADGLDLDDANWVKPPKGE